MKKVQNGSAVKLHYKGTFTDGKVFDDSKKLGTPMRVLVGNSNLIKGFESALIGMKEGQTKTINLSPEQAYGQVQEEAIITVPKTAFPQNFVFNQGALVSGNTPDGRELRAKIISIDEQQVVLDHNHPLAGKDINFEIELVEIEGAGNKFSAHTVKELKAMAREKGIKGFSGMKKAELVESLNS